MALSSSYLLRLEQDVKRLKADLQANRQLESDLRSQLSSMSSQDRSLRSELGQLRQDNELLQNKWVHLQSAHQQHSPLLSQLFSSRHTINGIIDLEISADIMKRLPSSLN